MADAEVIKLQNHLKLLREQYVKLQTKLSVLERKYQVATAKSGDVEDNFVSRLLQTVADLFDKELYSDLQVMLDGEIIKAHRFVLSARSDHWGVADLTKVESLDLTGIPYDIGHAMMKWVYTDLVDLGKDEQFILELMRTASKFRLNSLVEKCEKALMSSVTVRNCIRYYQIAEEIGAIILRDHCSELISNHWNDFTSDDFSHMTAPLLYAMFKQKTNYPLHTAIRTHREDVVFLFLIEFDSELPDLLDTLDDRGDIALDLALVDRLDGIADTLASHHADVNKVDRYGRCLLHKALKRGDEYAAEFLIRKGCDVRVATNLDKETALHITAAQTEASRETLEGMARIASQLLQHGADANAQNSNGCTTVHLAVTHHNEPVFTVLLKHNTTNLDIQDAEGSTPLWVALQTQKQYADDSFAHRLVEKKASTDAVQEDTGDCLLHRAARDQNEQAALFLASRGASVNLQNKKGETPLHTACYRGLAALTDTLLLRGANPNNQMSSVIESQMTSTEMQKSSLSSLYDEEEVTHQTPLHLAISYQHESCITVLLQHKERIKMSDNHLIMPNFNIKDSSEQTPFGLALWNGFHSVAEQLLKGGACVNDTNGEGMSLLHQAIMKQDTASARFLLDHGADLTMRTRERETPLQLAIKRHLPVVVDALCGRGANMNLMEGDGDSPLWQALETGQEDIAAILVKHGCDRDMWGPGPEGCLQTLLHRAVDESNEAVGVFLIRNGCDVNCCRKCGPNGEGADLGKIPTLNTAQQNLTKHKFIQYFRALSAIFQSQLQGQMRNSDTDRFGMYPHISGSRNTCEKSVEITSDKQAPLHMACSWGLETVVQALLEHQADVNQQDANGNTPLHIAIINQYPELIALLIAQSALNLALRDKHGLTPFAAAMMIKNNKAAQMILDREPTAAEQVDNKGRNFLHTAITKSDIESVLFLISVQANVNSRVQDAYAFTPLHLAVQAGSEIIVRNLLLAGAQVNAKAGMKQTCLHVAAEYDHAVIASVLIENGIQYDAVDDNQNNALHIAVQHGNLNTVRVLLTESRINAEAINVKGQNPLHVLGQYGKENAAAIFELFKESMPEYPLGAVDNEGNSVLLLSYMNGNANLCRSIVRAGCSLGTVNKQGFSIFNFPVPTKQLLFKLLDMLSREPQWSEGESCLECAVKFGIKTRKHHCRHCGRLLCSKCSDKDMPILKYNLTKPVRVCNICFDVLTLGVL